MTYRQLLSANPDFRRLWTGQVISEIGDWLNNIAVLALAIQLAGERRVGLAIAVYAIARHLPLFLFGPVAGVVADRLDRRRIMIVADVLRAALALGFLAADRLQSLAVIYAVGAALFAVASFFSAARRASIPNITRGADELLTANALTSSTFAATVAVGSALGGIVAALVSREFIFVANALTFLASAEMIRRVRGPLSKREEQTRAGSVKASDGDGETKTLFTQFGAVLGRAAWEFREGLRYVRRSRVLSAVFIVSAGWGLGNGAARALYSIFGARLGVEALEGSRWVAQGYVERPTDFGISVLFVAMGAGGIVGAAFARRFNRGENLGPRIGRSMVLDGLGLAVFSLMPNLWGAAAMLAAREINFAIWWTAQQTLVMRTTEDAYAGRVFASSETLTTLMMVGSMLASGAGSDRVGIRPVALAGGLIVACSGVLWFVLTRLDSRGTMGADSQGESLSKI
ncbi:MAG TPA: MFS transporter [Pyrinomonadaceae bacterium]|nr:MFS transporter [Pyrinomonadaceae bacterium]